MEALAGHLTKEENRAKKFEREADRYYIAKYMYFQVKTNIQSET